MSQTLQPERHDGASASRWELMQEYPGAGVWFADRLSSDGTPTTSYWITGERTNGSAGRGYDPFGAETHQGSGRGEVTLSTDYGSTRPSLFEPDAHLDID